MGVVVGMQLMLGTRWRRVVLWTLLAMGLPASGPVVLWIWIGVDNEVLMASAHVGPGNTVSGQTKWTFLTGGQLERMHNEEHSRCG